MTDPRDRTGVSPPGSLNFWLLGYGLLSSVIPLSAGAAAAVWSPLELDAFIYGLVAGLVIPMVLILPVAIGLRERRLWWVRWFFCAGTVLLIAYAATCLVVLAYPLGLVALRPGNDPGTVVLAWLAVIVMAIVGLPGAIVLIRALRQPYWQPGAPRERWAGQEHGRRVADV